MNLRFWGGFENVGGFNFFTENVQKEEKKKDKAEEEEEILNIIFSLRSLRYFEKYYMKMYFMSFLSVY